MWRARFVLLFGVVALLIVAGVAVQPSGDPHVEEALLQRGEVLGSGEVGGSELREIAGCDGVQWDDSVAPRSGRGASAPPPNPLGATEVGIGLFILEVVEVNEVDNTFTVESYMDNVWCDPRRPASGERETYVEEVAKRQLGRGWMPDITFVNQVEKPVVENQELIVEPDGTVEYRQKLNAKLEARYDLRRFPFDDQTLQLEVESFDWPVKNLQLRRVESAVGFSERFEIPEWRAVNVASELDEQQELRDRAKFSELLISLSVDRESGFYLWKIMVPLFLLVATSWSVFWMPGDSLSNRLAISFTGILTIVAYQFVIADVLPKVTYFTLWDVMLTFSFVLMLATVAVSVLVTGLHSRRRVLARQIDDTARVGFPATYLLGLSVFAIAYLA
jgi:Neurotransmitter-gated ion-channel ligand binding domain